jgi:hypothetical protein
MTAFLQHESAPERLLWCTVIHQAVRDLGHPNSNVHSHQTIAPLENNIFKTAMQLIFSGTEDDHIAWQYSGLSPKEIRSDVISKMKSGETVGQIGSRESPMGPIDYREVRRLVMRAYQQADSFYDKRGERALQLLFAPDCQLDMLGLIGEIKYWGKEL